MVHPWGFVNGALLQLLRHVSPLVSQGAYKSPNSQAPWETKGLTCRKSSKPLGGPRGLYVAKVASPLRDQGAYKSQKSQAPLWDQEAYMSPKS